MKTMAPVSIFYHIIFISTKSKTQKYLYAIYLLLSYFALLLIFYIYHYQISSLQITMKGLTTPLSHWVQVFVCLCRFYHWRLVCSSYWIDTFTTRENPSSSACLKPISSAGCSTTSKALQLKVSSSVGWTTLLLYRLSSSAFYYERYW